jgi:hypothetical protein
MAVENMMIEHFDSATGRQLRCHECHKPLERSSPEVTSIVCANCGTTKLLPLSLAADDDFKSEFVLSDTSLRQDKRTKHAICQATASQSTDFDSAIDEIEDEFVLRPARGSTAQNRESFVANQSESEHVTSEYRTGQAREAFNHSSGVYPRERHYPTLEAMQRLYRVSGYAAFLIVFPYLGIRCLRVLFTTKEGLLLQLGEFSEFAVPLIFACVAFTSIMFGLSEGIKLATDIQDNTLRIANRYGRRKD